VKGPFFTSSVAVFQPCSSTSRPPGLVSPSAWSAAMAVANSLSVSRGGLPSQRVMASMPPGARCWRYAWSASIV